MFEIFIATGFGRTCREEHAADGRLAHGRAGLLFLVAFAAALALPIKTTVGQALAGDFDAVEPITSRPVADRFNFTNGSYSGFLSSPQSAPDSLQADTVASTSDNGNGTGFNSPNGAHGKADGSTRSVIVAQPSGGAKVAGWRHLRRLSAQPPPQNTMVETVAAPPALSALELGKNGDVITATEAQPERHDAENKLRRTRTSKRSSKPKTNEPPGAPFATQRKWEMRALFPE